MNDLYTICENIVKHNGDPVAMKLAREIQDCASMTEVWKLLQLLIHRSHHNNWVITTKKLTNKSHKIAQLIGEYA